MLGETIQADFEQENQLRNIQKNFRKLTPAVRSEKVLAITAPRRESHSLPQWEEAAETHLRRLLRGARFQAASRSALAL